MSKIVSLSKHRKARARTEARRQADANAVKFGRRKSQKALETAKAEQDKTRLDGHETE